MWPSFDLPGTGVSISSYHFLHVISWFVFFFVGSTLTRSRPDLRILWVCLAVGLAVCDTAGARLAARLIRGPRDGGFFAGPLLFVVVTTLFVVARKIRAYPFLDAWAIAFSAAHFFEKFSCLAAGCCYGRPTHSAMGVALRAAQGDPTRFLPLPFYEATLHLTTTLALALFYAKGQFKGRLLLVLGVLYGTWRSMVDPARYGRMTPFLGGPLSIVQVACILVAVFSLTYLLSFHIGRVRAKSVTPR